MKTTLIILLLAVAVLLGPPTIATGESVGAANNQVALNVADHHQVTAQALNDAEMNVAVGGGMSGCFKAVDANGDLYGTCCVDLWIFTICVSVNYSAVERAIGSLF
jgi:hypothetical protein